MLSDVVLSPYKGGAVKRTVIILHGLGDSAAGIIGLGEAMRAALPETEFVAPDAPFPCEFSPFGYQWFSAADWTTAVVLEGVKRAAKPLNEYIDHILKSRNLPPEQVALLGFSQGTMMSLYVAPRREQALAGVLGYSGALIGGENLVKERRSAPPVQLVHGTADDVVPFSSMAHAVKGLHVANISVNTFACEGLSHSIDDKGISTGIAFLRRAFKLLPNS